MKDNKSDRFKTNIPAPLKAGKLVAFNKDKTQGLKRTSTN